MKKVLIGLNWGVEKACTAGVVSHGCICATSTTELMLSMSAGFHVIGSTCVALITGSIALMTSGVFGIDSRCVAATTASIVSDRSAWNSTF